MRHQSAGKVELTAEEIKSQYRADYISAPYRGYRSITVNGRCFIVDKFGKKCSQRDYSYIGEVYDGFRAACFYQDRDLRWTYLTYDGKPAFKGQTFDTAHDFCHGLARVEVKSRAQEWRGDFFYINVKGLNPFVGFEQVGEFHDGLAVARQKNGRYIYITMMGSPLIRNQSFLTAWPFHNGFGQVMMNNGEKVRVTHAGHFLQ